jgi:hypothetical protein
MQTVQGNSIPSNAALLGRCGTPPPSTPNLADLLERVGFRIRGRRADCIHCEGHSRLTVSFNDEVAFCHRCKWTRNVRTLSRELGLPVAPLAPEMRETRDQHEQLAEWSNTVHMILMRDWRYLTLRAEFAKQVLAGVPACEPAWGALADFYHSEAGFAAAFEFLACEKLPQYLDAPMTKEKLFTAFSDATVRTEREQNAV